MELVLFILGQERVKETDDLALGPECSGMSIFTRVPHVIDLQLFLMWKPNRPRNLFDFLFQFFNVYFTRLQILKFGKTRKLSSIIKF